MSYININEIKARFSHYAKLVMKGESLIIAMRNTPFAIISPYKAKNNETKELKFGLMEGQFTVPEDFNSSLEDFEDSYYKS